VCRQHHGAGRRRRRDVRQHTVLFIVPRCVSWSKAVTALAACNNSWTVYSLHRCSILGSFRKAVILWPVGQITESSYRPRIATILYTVLDLQFDGARFQKEALANFSGKVKIIRKQDAQLSQRDRAAGCVIVFAKSRRLELGDNILRTL